jgi:hypothetical protein
VSSDGTSIEVTYTEDGSGLDQTSVPSPDRFTVTIGTELIHLDHDAVSIEDNVLTLELPEPVRVASGTVTVAYTVTDWALCPQPVPLR